MTETVQCAAPARPADGTDPFAWPEGAHKDIGAALGREYPHVMAAFRQWTDRELRVLEDVLPASRAVRAGFWPRPPGTGGRHRAPETEPIRVIAPYRIPEDSPGPAGQDDEVQGAGAHDRMGAGREQADFSPLPAPGPSGDGLDPARTRAMERFLGAHDEERDEFGEDL